jgi:sugar diacid utilization regulator
MLCRLVAPVHAGGELLGSIWAAVKDRPGADRERALADATKLAALHLLRHRAGLDLERNLQADLLAAILDGGAAARESAVRLGLSEGGFRVLAISADHGSDGSMIPRLRDALTVHMTRKRVPGAAAVLGGVVLAVISCGVRKHSDLRARDIATGLISAVEIGDDTVPLIGIGGHADFLSEVPRSRKEAEEVLRVLRVGRHTESVATIDEARVQVLLTRFAEVAAEEKEMYAAKIQPLIDADQAHTSAYVDSLRAYFEAFGDMNAAARSLNVHPNTLRYRLRRAQELSGIRLDDHNERLALMLLLSVLLRS